MTRQQIPVWAALVAAGFFAGGGVAWGQQAPRRPQIGYVYPAGGQVGTTVEVTVGGQVLGGANEVLVTGSGVRATVVRYKRPLTIGEVNRIRDRLEEARKKLYPNATGPLRPANLFNLRELAREAGISDDQLMALEEFRRRRSDPKRQPNPQIEEEVTIRVEIAPEAEPGVRELRLRSPLGLSNPVRFVAGRLPELSEIEPNDRLPDTSIGARLPVVMNGQIMPGDVDRFTFTARKGTQLVVNVEARSLIPYLADAVPGWFQAVVALYDRNGRELAYADDFQFQPDPVLCTTIPADGEYTLVVRDSLYRGREDFVYRVTLGELPFVTSVFPLGTRVGVRASARLRGWNLSAPTLLLHSDSAGIHPLPLGRGAVLSKELFFHAGDLPDVPEKEPNDRTSQAQLLRLPCIVNGALSRAGDVDVFQFRGRKGDRVVAEVIARRLGSPTDSVLRLTDAHGRPVASNDDWEDRAAGWLTHHADSYLAATLPADGVYYLRLADTQGGGGPDFGYRLRVSPARPDFELRVTPSSVGVRAGMTVPVTVHVIRRDGFDGPVDLALDGAPAGFVLSGARIPAGSDSVTLTMTCSPQSPIERPRFAITGAASIGGTIVQRVAKPADERMQAFAYTHLVDAQEWVVAVEGRAFAPPPRPFTADNPLRIPVGGKATIRVPVPGRPLNRQVTVELDAPPQGITLENWDPSTGTVTVRAETGQARPGTRGNLILQIFMSRPNAAAQRPAAPARVIALGYLPAIPFEVVER